MTYWNKVRHQDCTKINHEKKQRELLRQNNNNNNTKEAIFQQ